MASNDNDSSNLGKPLKTVPGSYGLPFLGAIIDRYRYFYTQGEVDFFKNRIKQYNSTVFRTNMPPGPFISSNSRVICLLDAVSFPTLFDNSLVEKKDLFTGTYMPTTHLTGGHRILSYLDTKEPKHTALKQLLFNVLGSRHQFIIHEFRRTFGNMFEDLEAEIARKGVASFANPNDQACFNFLGRALLGKDPLETKLKSDGPGLITKWLAVQLAPVFTLKPPAILGFLEDLLLHTFPLPSIFVKSAYNKLVDFFREAAGPALDEAEKLGISKDEAVHNLVFAICFNSFGGMKFLFPELLKYIGQAGPALHQKLVQEIRAAVKSNGGEVTLAAMEQMPLMKSVVYETLRVDPPVRFQYARARKDFVVYSHDAGFQVKAGEMLFGYQPLVTQDPKVFDRAEEFVPDRFVGPEGEKLLRYVFWSNGRETDSAATSNKQCAGKDFVVTVARLLVVELFMRYDKIDLDVGPSPLGPPAITLKALQKASA